MFQGSIDINMLIGFILGAIVPTLVVIIQIVAERRRQARDHELLLAQFRAELMTKDFEAIDQALDEITKLLRSFFGLHMGEVARKEDIFGKLYSMRDALACASWRSWSLSTEIRDLMEDVLNTADEIIALIAIGKRQKVDPEQVREIGKVYDQQAGKLRKAIRAYHAEVRAGNLL